MPSVGTTVVNAVSAFTFTEVTGQKRTLRLQGRGLPFRPFHVTTRQRHKRTMLPGYSQATITLLGPEEVPSDINGKWSDKFISESSTSAEPASVVAQAFSTIDQQIGAAGRAVGLGSNAGYEPSNDIEPITFAGKRVQDVREAAGIIDTWVREGRLLEVAWGEIAYHGIIEEFEKSWHNAHDLEWTMHFAWQGRAEATLPAVLAEELSVGDTASLFQQLADALGSEALPPKFTMANDVLRDVDQGIKRIADTTQRVADTVAAVAGLAMAPVAAARQISALSRTIASQCQELIDTLQTYRRDAASLFRSAAEVDPVFAAQTAARPASVLAASSVSPGDKASAREYVRAVVEAARALRSAAYDKARAYASTADGSVQAEHVAAEGEDLREVSRRYYGTPNEWRRLLLHNGLSSARLVAGQVVQVPKAGTEDAC